MDSPAAPQQPTTDAVIARREHNLHVALKVWCAQPGDQLEAPVEGYIVDILRGERIVEIQTRGFGALRQKLADLLPRHPVQVVHPIALERWIVRLSADGATRQSRRRSPKRGRLEQLFGELVYLVDLVRHPNLSLCVLLTREEELRCPDGRGSWRRQGWSIADRLLLEVVERVEIADASAYAAFLPAELPEPFTTRDLAAALTLPIRTAQQMLYCLRRLGHIAPQGRRGRAPLYVRTSSPTRLRPD